MISAVILAAGMSRRMGSPKLLLKLGSKTIIEHVVDNVLSSNAGEVIVVSGAEKKRLEQVLAKYTPVLKVVHNSRYTEGQGTSVAAGAAAVHDKSDGIMYLLGDQPLIFSRYINKLIEKFYQYNPYILRPEGAGNPTIFNIKLKDELMFLSGDVGGRQLLNKYKNEIISVAVQGMCDLDVDTKQDYQKLVKIWKLIAGTD